MNGRWWSADEKKELNGMLESHNFNFDLLALKSNRSLYAVHCQVIKWCNERSKDPLSYGVPASSLRKYEDKAQTKLSEKKTERSERSERSTELLEIVVKTLLQNVDELRTTVSRLESKIDEMMRLRTTTTTYV